MAKRMPMIETGIVENSIPKSTEGNYAALQERMVDTRQIAHHMLVALFGFVHNFSISEGQI